MSKVKTVILKAARTEAQKNKMRDILKKGICPFCPKYLEKYHDHPIEKQGKFWVITKNDYPYEGSKYHYLFISKKHIEHIEELEPKAFAELASLAKWLSKKHNLLGGSFFMRFGNPKYSSASVTHLHAHLIVGKKKSKEILNVPLGYK